jgi:hypothetical protein
LRRRQTSGKTAYPPAASPEQTIWCWAEAEETSSIKVAAAQIVFGRAIVDLSWLQFISPQVNPQGFSDTFLKGFG